MMQIKVTDKDFYKSASNLTRQDLNAQIYEAIHVLACNLNVQDNLVNPILGQREKSIKNHPVSKLWGGYERELEAYVYAHIVEWGNRGYKSDINIKNYHIITKSLDRGIYYIPDYIPDWITDEFIQMHRSNLIRKEIEREEKYVSIYYKLEFKYSINPDHKLYDKLVKQENIIKHNYHYRNLWPDCPNDIPMRYNFKKIKKIKKNIVFFKSGSILNNVR
jgi:hypothetical protein